MELYVAKVRLFSVPSGGNIVNLLLGEGGFHENCLSSVHPRCAVSRFYRRRPGKACIIFIKGRILYMGSNYCCSD